MCQSPSSPLYLSLSLFPSRRRKLIAERLVSPSNYRRPTPSRYRPGGIRLHARIGSDTIDKLEKTTVKLHGSNCQIHFAPARSRSKAKQCRRTQTLRGDHRSPSNVKIDRGFQPRIVIGRKNGWVKGSNGLPGGGERERERVCVTC